MGLTPDEIADRAFTPSVDGYHQAEVRSFLERVAYELRSLQASLPEGAAQLAQLAAAVQSHEPRLGELQKQLAEAVADLSTTSRQLHQAQRASTDLLLVSRDLAEDQAKNAAAAAEASAAAQRIESDQRRLLERLEAERERLAEHVDRALELAGPATGDDAERTALTDHLEAAAKLAAQQREAAEHLAQAGEQAERQHATERQALKDQLAAVTKLVAQQREAAEHLAQAGEQAERQHATERQALNDQLAALTQLAADQREAARSSERTAGPDPSWKPQDPATGASSTAPGGDLDQVLPRDRPGIVPQPYTDPRQREVVPDDDTASSAQPTPMQAPGAQSRGVQTPGAIADSADPPTSSAPTSTTAPSSGATSSGAASSSSSAVGAPSLFSASDLDEQPLFTDNAIDLLDGVLDDVMGDITDEGTTS